MESYPFPIEDKRDRSPEWEDVELADGQPPTLRTYEWDPITNTIRVTGPLIEMPMTRKDRHERPVP